MFASTKMGVKQSELRAVILNKDGTVKQDLGVIAYYHRNPLMRMWWNIKRGVSKWLQ